MSNVTLDPGRLEVAIAMECVNYEIGARRMRAAGHDVPPVPLPSRVQVLVYVRARLEDIEAALQVGEPQLVELVQKARLLSAVALLEAREDAANGAAESPK